MPDFIPKLLTGLFFVVGIIAAVLGFSSKMKGEGKAEAKAESDASELEAVKENHEIVQEVKSHNRSITPKQLFAGLRKHANKNRD